MNVLAVLLAYTTLTAPTFAAEAGSRLFVCEVQDARQFIKAGNLEPVLDLHQIMERNLVFDEATGLLSSPVAPPGRVKYEIWNRGDPSGGNDLVAYRSYRTKSGSDPFTVLRIRAWSEGAPFLYLTPLYVVTGTCQIE